MAETILHTDGLERRYGPVTALVREHNPQQRVIDIVDAKGISRTHAITWFPDNSNDEISDIRREVAEGALVGKTFRQHGFSVQKPPLIKGEIPLPQWLRERFSTVEQTAHVLVYEFWGVNETQIVLYGIVAEIYSPDYMPPSEDDQYLFQVNKGSTLNTQQISESLFSYLNDKPL